MAPPFDLEKFLVDVFAPEPDEQVAVMVDGPTADVPDNEEWRGRRTMAEEWRVGLEALGAKIGFEVLPLVVYPAVGTHGADFPAEADVGGRKVAIASILDEVSLVLVLSEFSATA